MDRTLKLEQKKEGNPYQFIVNIPEHFRDNSWSDTIGKFQKEIDGLTINEYITFDFRQCRWIDPLPLLSLLIEIVRAKKRYVNVDALFPAPDSGEIDLTSSSFYKKSPNRFLLFLTNEGFFSELTKYIPFTIGKDKLEVDNSKNNLQALKKYADISETPCYVDSYFIPVKLYDVPLLSDLVNAESFAAETVESLLDDIELALHAKCSAPERRYLLYKLRAILQEFLHNVQEHAYSNENIRLAALYVRYRQGGAILPSDTEKQIFDDGVNKEYENCKKTSKDWLVSRTGCLEVFFLDRGLGIVNHFYSEKEEKKDVFDKVIRETFYEGKSIKFQRKTEHGGLHLLHELMKRNTDYVRALDDKTWIGLSVPFDRETDSIKIYKEVEEGFTGLAYHIRLGWKASTENSQTWSKFNTEEINRIWSELSKTANECEKLFNWFKQCTIWDERLGKDNYFEVGNSEFIFWLPKPNRMKWDILNRLEYLSKKISNNSLLIIADIPSIEAATYKAAMSNCSFHPNEEWPNKFDKIFLCTNRWSFAYAVHEKLENDTHGFSTFDKEKISENFQSGLSQEITGNISFRILVIQMLKWHDSNILWGEIEKNKRLFIAEEVEWNGDKIHFSSKKEPQTMAGYLDFPATTHNRICRLLYRRALGRVFGFMDENKTELVPVDSLADSVVHDVGYHETYDPPENSNSDIEKIAVGSVLVSGSTLKSVGVDKNIHCLVHDSFYQNYKDIARFSLLKEVVKNKDDLPLVIDAFEEKLKSNNDPYELIIINLKTPVVSIWIIAGLNFENKFTKETLTQDIDKNLINELNKQYNTKYGLEEDKRNIITLILLKLGRTLNNHPALFHWQPIPAIQKVEQKQTRIGKTSEIAPRGWLSIEIPRYSFDSNPISIGYRTPKETYQDWQNSSPVTVKLGHWCYEGHHDLLTINIPDVVEDAFVRKKPLANFLIGNILAFLGIHQSQLKNDSAKYTNEPIKGCDFQVISVNTNKKREEKAKRFKLEFESKTNLCAILVVNLPKTPTKRWVYGFNEKNEFICEYIDDVDNDLIIELMKEPACLIKASKLALAILGRTYLEPGIIIYRSHPSSERIMNNVFNCIQKEYRSSVMDKVFPILPLRKRFGGSTLLIPPRLQKEIKESAYKKHIMVFDDASISGRTLQDLRTTLNQLGAGTDDFQIVLIANRLRLPAEAGKIKYFWRMDIPTMGREGTCPLCHGLNQVKSFSTHLVNTSASYNIIKSWLKEWEAVSPIHKWDTGLNSLPILLEEKDYCYRENVGHLTKIPIYRSIGLSIHTAEIHAMTARDDYGLKKIRNQSDPAVQVEIAASQLLLFGNELDQDLIYDFIVEGLIIPLSKLPDKSPVASLTVLVIMQSLTIVTLPLQKAVANIVKKNITALLNKNHGLILIAYFLANDLLNRNNQLYYEALRLLSTRHASVSEKLRSLFLETLSQQGNIHSKPIPKLISDIPILIGKIQELIDFKSRSEDKISDNDIPKVSENLITNALDSMASIKDIVSELGSELAKYTSKNHSTHSTPSNFSEKKRELNSCIKIARKTLEKPPNLDEQYDLKEVQRNLEEMLHNLENVQHQLNLIANLYFFRISKSSVEKEGGTLGDSFKEEVGKIWKGDSQEFDEDLSAKNRSADHIIEHSIDSVIGSDFGNAEWIWIPWHKHIVTLIRDLLTNVTHRSEKTSDPWDDKGSTNSKADIWVNIKFEAEKVNIYMANACNNDSKKIFEEIEKGTSDKTRWTSLKELGGIIELDKEKSSEKLFCIKISIPYAPFLSTVQPSM